MRITLLDRRPSSPDASDTPVRRWTLVGGYLRPSPAAVEFSFSFLAVKSGWICTIGALPRWVFPVELVMNARLTSDCFDHG